MTKKEQEFIDYLDAVVEAELDLEHTIFTDYNKENIGRDFAKTKEIRKEFFEWFTNIISAKNVT